MSKVAFGTGAGLAALLVFALATPADALTMKQCSEKYKAAQSAGAVDSMTWSEFRAAECAAGATMDLKVKEPKLKSTAEAGPSMQECSARYKEAKSAGTLGEMTWNEFRKAGCAAKTAATRPAREHRAKTSPKKEAATAAPATLPAPTATKVSEQECSSRYQAAKAANTLAGMSWNEFRKAGCPATIAQRRGEMLSTSGSLYPTAIARKYVALPAGRARMLTCRDQYEANKTAGIVEHKWSEQGGGYYSECNKRLGGQ